jgi:Methyltransferase domain
VKLHEREQQSIVDFLLEHADKLAGNVLDIGCGLQPYRGLVKDAGGTYTGYDSGSFPGSVVVENVGPSWSQITLRHYDAVLMTQVWEYMEPYVLSHLLEDLADDVVLRAGGWLLATGPTNWPAVEPEDLWRFTTSGVLHLLSEAGFEEIAVESRHAVKVADVWWSCGWAAAARSTS